jgi:hypothetical protein
LKAKYGDLLTGHGTKRPKLPRVQSQRGHYTAFGQCHWLGPFLHRTPTFCRPDNLTVPASIPFYRVNPSTISRVWPRCGGLNAGRLFSVTDSATTPAPYPLVLTRISLRPKATLYLPRPTIPDWTVATAVCLRPCVGGCPLCGHSLSADIIRDGAL